ncbi:unnamed protein product [Schistocephalus solidus]|uniref:Adenosine deaminase n=2 Tax=Schistocephalus solidus TaxID=70667 RepID=A0A0X3P7V7_SCHSO|nr:unnamed protein product [Schistocephalus solidus]
MNFSSSRHGVELHLHLDGGFRPATLFAFAQKKSIRLCASNTYDFEKSLTVQQPNSLADFLSKFSVINSPAQGDAEALSQLTLDFLEDCANRGGLCYVEARFSPHLLAGACLTPEETVKTVLSAVEIGKKRFDIQAQIILCMMRHRPEWSSEVVQLAKSYQPFGVCAIDVAGDDKPCDGKNTAKEIKMAFDEAFKCGIHRVAHAGENGVAASVTEALSEMHAERIGHGYHILDDPIVYKTVREENVHFELCPLSSRLTGSVPIDWNQHPIHNFIRDDVNFSINTDDPTVTGQWQLEEQLMCMRELGMTAHQLVKANFRAAQASFLQDDDKEQLMRHLMTGAGIITIRG